MFSVRAQRYPYDAAVCIKLNKNKVIPVLLFPILEQMKPSTRTLGRGLDSFAVPCWLRFLLIEEVR